MTWEPTRWRRVVRDVPDPGPADIWCETSDEGEARRRMAGAPYPVRLERLWQHTESEWRSA